jgi:hypothetical protein
VRQSIRSSIEREFVASTPWSEAPWEEAVQSAHTAQVVDLAAARERAARRAGGWPAGGPARMRVARPAAGVGAGRPRPRTCPSRAPVSRPTARRAVAAPPPLPLRLTRRGRVVVVAVIALAIAAVLVLVLPRASIAWSGEPPRGHLVLAGETLWEIAVALDPDADTRVVVGRLMRINHLPSVELTPGQFLLLG